MIRIKFKIFRCVRKKYKYQETVRKNSEYQEIYVKKLMVSEKCLRILRNYQKKIQNVGIFLRKDSVTKQCVKKDCREK